jgi:glycosyltransferase involved in cell wall biosynthesis
MLCGAFMKKRIGLFLGTEPYGGGVFQYNLAMLEAVAALPRSDFNVVVAFTSTFWSSYVNDYAIENIFVSKGTYLRRLSQLYRILSLPMGMWRNLCHYLDPVAKTLFQTKCDLWIFPSEDVASYQFPGCTLVSIHDLMHRYESQFPEVSKKLQYYLREQNYRNICKWSKGVLVDSCVGKSHVMESYALEERRIHVLPYIAPRYMYAKPSNENLVSHYNLPKKFIFYPSQFWEHKNHKRLIEAIASLGNIIPDLKLVLSGSKKNRYNSVIELVQKLNLDDDVIFLGYVPNESMPEIYQRARALVMPTFFGPTNIPPLEAFVAGCPVATSDIYGMPEQVGDAALLFDPNSTEEIGNAIYRLWTDDALCADLSIKGKEKAAKWGQQQFNLQLCEIIEHIIYH